MEGRLTGEELERLIQEFLAAAENEQDQTEEDRRRMVANGNERITEVSNVVFQMEGYPVLVEVIGSLLNRYRLSIMGNRLVVARRVDGFLESEVKSMLSKVMKKVIKEQRFKKSFLAAVTPEGEGPARQAALPVVHLEGRLFTLSMIEERLMGVLRRIYLKLRLCH